MTDEELTDEELPPRVRAAEERREYRQLLARSSLGCPWGDCDHMLHEHEGCGWARPGNLINARCRVPGCPCPVH